MNDLGSAAATLIARMRRLRHGQTATYPPELPLGSALWGLEQEVIGVASQIEDLEDLRRVEAGMLEANRAALDDLATRRRAELEQAQADLVQSAKLAALGVLGAGIAHELNQPLSVIAMLAEMLLEDSALAPGQRASTETILEQVGRMARIVNNIRAFARETKAVRVRVCLREVAQRSVDLVDQQFRSQGVFIEQAGDTGSFPMLGDPLVLQQVVINLLINARDALIAIPHRGASRIRVQLLSTSTSVAVCVEDNGPGIEPTVAARIFDPFFTTKTVGSGTGLGLSISRGIVHQHDGTLRLQPSSLGGAAFEASFPIDAGAEEPNADAPILPAPTGPDPIRWTG